MIRANAETTIEAPASEVWSYAADIARHPEWMTVASAEVLAGTGERVGDRGRERIRVGPIARDAEFTVVAAEPGRRIVWRTGAGSPVDGDLELELEAIGPDRTRARYGGSFTGRGWVRFLEPLIALEVRRGPATELHRLKDAIERGRGRVVGAS